MRVTLRSLSISRRLFLSPILLVGLLAIAAPQSFAMNQPSVDLDSMVFLATDIGVGKISGKPGSTADVKIEKTFADDLKPGAVVTVAAIDFFDGLHDADRVYFFLVDAKPEFLFNPPPGSKIPIYAGLKVVVDGRVCAFTQHSNPGAYELDTPRPGEDLLDFPAPGEFERKLAASQAKVAVLRRTTLAPAADRAQIPGLVALIAARHPRSYPDQEDAITQFAASRLANFHDPASPKGDTRTY